VGPVDVRTPRLNVIFSKQARYLRVLDKLRSLVGRFMLQQLRRPGTLAIRAWLWLAAEAPDAEEKLRCLNAILQLAPANEFATLALLLFDQRRPTSYATALGTLSTCVACATLSDRPY
jgi:hypothetical protein